MNSRAMVLAGGWLLSAGAYAAKAPPPPPPAPGTTSTTTTTTNHASRDTVYAGLKWELPGPLAPSLVLGVRHAQTQSDNDVHGVDVSMAFAVFGGFKPGKLRVKGFIGNRDIQGELGL